MLSVEELLAARPYVEKLVAHHWRYEDREDLVQEIMERALRRREMFDGSRPNGSLKAWLAAVTRNFIIDHYRILGRYNGAIKRLRATMKEVEKERRRERPLGVASTKVKLDMFPAYYELERWVQELPRADYRYFIRRRYFHEDSVKEVAFRTGIKEDTVKVGLYRARKLLREMAARKGYADF